MYNIKFKGNFSKKEYDNELLPKNSIKVPTNYGKILSIFLIVIMIILTLFNFITSKPITNHSPSELIFCIFVTMICLLPIFILHEFLHAICFPKNSIKEIWYEYNKKNLFLFSFQVYTNTPLKRNNFLFMLLLPNILLSIIPLIIWHLGILSDYPFISRIFGAVFTILFTSGASDYSLFFDTILNTSKNDYILMYKNNFYYTNTQ
ncbi:metalloprotease family protein [Thomasclavelia spiroformis]|uniref:metalloprotease family protein n=1 Tax=Thomasclavelia spiroformis TaxID=29348 RepID=UPI00241BEAAF|nr:metalloprotease family protein [Thomasclavelia spiroformis]MBS6114266.1 DUF3267 domain-containing protein [Thomasclavelia spiroformis]